MGDASADEIVDWMRQRILRGPRRRGAVVAVSGGIDSTVALHLAARAVGCERVTALYLPELATSSETRSYVVEAVEGRAALIERDITPVLDAAGCYEQLDEVLRTINPTWSTASHAFALALDGAFARTTGALRYVLRVRPFAGGDEMIVALRSGPLSELVAANNFKQRIRMVHTYNEAERRRSTVVGTSNGDELDFGFVVKYGDHAGDVQPLARLTKTQVYDLARELGVPQRIIDRVPTTDTFSLPQTQEDYYYALDPQDMRRLMDDPELSSAGYGDGARQLVEQLRRSSEVTRLEPLQFDPDHPTPHQEMNHP